MTVRPIFRFDPGWPKIRLFVAIWKGGHEKLAVALRPRLLRWESSYDGWRLCLLGIELHRQVSACGRFV